MNLIEMLGGYEQAKAFLAAIEYKHVEKALLAYRRENNIFEVGDKVVHHKFSNMKIYEVCEINGDLITVFWDRKSHSFSSDIRHATDEEIKAGRRL